MRSAELVGRVGGLAVALGIGTGLLAGAGAAWADSEPDSSAGSDSTTSSSADSGSSTASTSPASSSSSAAGTESSDSASAEDDSDDTSGGDSEDGTEDDAENDAADSTQSEEQQEELDLAADESDLADADSSHVEDGAATEPAEEATAPLVDTEEAGLPAAELSSDESSEDGAEQSAATYAASAGTEADSLSAAAVTQDEVVDDTGWVLDDATATTVAGQVLATSTRDLPLTYTLTAGPDQGGSVELDEDTGYFTTTVGPSVVSGKATEEFTVLVSETTHLVAALQQVPIIGQFVEPAVRILQQTPIVNLLLMPLIGSAVAVPVRVDSSMLAGRPATIYAPYVDVTLDDPKFDYETAVTEYGIDSFSLAFIVSDPDDPGTPVWGYSTAYALDDPYITSTIDEIELLGADAILSFGGALGNYLATDITDVDTLVDAYQDVIDAYEIYNLDFDVEGTQWEDEDSVDRRNNAIALLQQQNLEEGNEVTVSYTIPVLPTGLTDTGIYELQSAINYGVDVSVVNIMTFDYYDTTFAPTGEYYMGDLAVQAATAVHDQLADLYGDAKTDEELWAMIGITSMIGYADDLDEVFYLHDAQQIVDFAVSYGIGRLSIWSANRDMAVSTDADGCNSDFTGSSNYCNGISFVDFAYSRVFEQAEMAGTDPRTGTQV